jgi:hypothetical protein
MVRKTTKRRRGGGYGFGGSILSNAAGSGAGNAMWSKTGGECGAARVGNNDLPPLEGGRRRRRRNTRRRKTAKKGGRRSLKGGNVLALQQPRAGYTFNGEGAGGIADAVPAAPNVTYV